MPTPEPFVRFGAPHLTALAVIAAVTVTLIVLVRRRPRLLAPVCWTLAAVLVANGVAVYVTFALGTTASWRQVLPMHLCDWLTLLVAAALVLRRSGVYEVAWYWGLAGTAQSLVTPDLAYGFPHPLFWAFQIGHGGIVAAVLLLTFGAGLRPGPGSWLRAFAWIQVYLVAAVVVNLALDTNYGYVCAKPAVASLLDHLGPWPWYLVSLEAVALGLFGLLRLPWWLAERRDDRADDDGAGQAGRRPSMT